MVLLFNVLVGWSSGLMQMKITSWHVLEMSVTVKNSPQDDQPTTNVDSPGFKSFIVLLF